MVKSETPSFDFAKVWLKGEENGSEKLETSATFLGLGFTKFSSKVQNSSKYQPFSPPLSQTLAKSNDGVSLLTKFSELKSDHRFGCPFDIKMCTPTFSMVRAIWTPSSPTLAKMHDGVSLLTNFLELKFDHRFVCPFDREACPPTFATL